MVKTGQQTFNMFFIFGTCSFNLWLIEIKVNSTYLGLTHTLPQNKYLTNPVTTDPQVTLTLQINETGTFHKWQILLPAPCAAWTQLEVYEVDESASLKRQCEDRLLSKITEPETQKLLNTHWTNSRVRVFDDNLFFNFK